VADGVVADNRRCLAPLHNLDFVTPALVSLAAFKIYSHRLELAQKAEDERSVMWGSSPAAVEAYLRQIDAEAVIEEVLSSVKAPL
jgi:MoxR-like ATPase